MCSIDCAVSRMDDLQTSLRGSLCWIDNIQDAVARRMCMLPKVVVWSVDESQNAFQFLVPASQLQRRQLAGKPGTGSGPCPAKKSGEEFNVTAQMF